MIPRKSPLRRVSAKQQAKYPNATKFSTVVKRGGKPKAKSRKRERNDPLRIKGPDTFQAFLYAHPCLGCGRHGYIQQAHLKNGGTGRKASWRRTAPLCGPHEQYHNGFGGYAMTEGCHQQYDDAKKSDFAQRIRDLHEHFWARWCLECGRQGWDPSTGKPNA